MNRRCLHLVCSRVRSRAACGYRGRAMVSEAEFVKVPECCQCVVCKSVLRGRNICAERFRRDCVAAQ